jgi:hypothetical protein
MASNDCLPYKNSYLAADVGAASVEAGVITVVGAASVDDGTITVVGAASVEAGLASDEVASPLLQAANEAAITNTQKSFFMLSVFFDFV